MARLTRSLPAIDPASCQCREPQKSPISRMPREPFAVRTHGPGQHSTVHRVSPSMLASFFAVSQLQVTSLPRASSPILGRHYSFEWGSSYNKSSAQDAL